MSLLRSFIPSARNLFCNSMRFCNANVKKQSVVSSIIPDYTLEIFNANTKLEYVGPIVVSTLPSTAGLVSITLDVSTGSRYETEESNGANFFLQHLAFTGKSQTGNHFGKILENIGARVNVSSTRENVAYTITCLPEYTDTAINILADMTKSLSNITDEQVSNSRNCVLQQKKKIESCKINRSLDHLHSIIYQQDSFGFTKEGSEKVLQNITAKTLNQYASEYYQNNRYSIGVSGVCNTKNIFENIRTHFSAVGSPKLFDKPSTPKYFGSVVTERDDTNDNVTFTLGFEGTTSTHPNFYPLAIVKELIGNYSRYSGTGDNHSGRLGELLAHDDTCDSFSTFNYTYSDCGVFGIMAESQGKKLDPLVCEICHEFVRLGHNARPGEFERAKKKLKNRYLASCEGTDVKSKEIASFAKEGLETPSLKDRLDGIDDVSIEKFREVCCDHFMDTEPAIVGIGSTKNVPDYNQVRGWTHWWRI